jgi:hypothetical protein
MVGFLKGLGVGVPKATSTARPAGAKKKGDFLSSIFPFIMAHGINVSLVVLAFFLVATYVILYNVKFPKEHPVLQRVVTMEAMTNGPSFNKTLRDGFCSTTLGNSSDRHANCGKLSETQCGLVKCCCWARQAGEKGFQCVAGTASGPTFDPTKTDEYYYLGKLRARKKPSASS